MSALIYVEHEGLKVKKESIENMETQLPEDETDQASPRQCDRLISIKRRQGG